jgi:hypothetical protein
MALVFSKGNIYMCYTYLKHVIYFNMYIFWLSYLRLVFILLFLCYVTLDVFYILLGSDLILYGSIEQKYITITITITQADVLRNVGDTAAVIFPPSKQPQYDLHSSHMAVYKQAVATRKICKVVIRLC